jgi:hypothetical protein
MLSFLDRLKDMGVKSIRTIAVLTLLIAVVIAVVLSLIGGTTAVFAGCGILWLIFAILSMRLSRILTD